jgi:Protein of unknown function (DUF3891)
MIVTRVPEGLAVVLQVDHQDQCGAMADLWGGEGFTRPSPFAPLRHAAAVHDEGWRPWEEAPEIGEAGAPLDFPDIDRRVHVDLYREGIAGAIDASPAAGLLVSMHGAGLYSGRLGLEDAPPDRPAFVTAFIEEQLAVQEDVLAGLDLGPGADAREWAWACYRLLQAWDRLSLYLTWRGLPQGRDTTLPRVPRAPGDEAGVDLLAGPLSALECALDPFPFAVEPAALPVRRRVIADRRYASHDDLRAALAAAAWETVTYLAWRAG